MKYVIVSLLLLLSGCFLRGNCAPTQMWTKDGATPADFYWTKFVCIQQSQFNGPDNAIGVNWESYNECMQAFGYTPVEKK